MYLRATKHVLTEAVKKTFDEDYPVEQLQGLYASIEYPFEIANYPGIWVDFETTGPVSNIGIGHAELVETTNSIGETVFETYKRWRFQGYASFTCVALTSYVRDLMYDEMLRVIAFGVEMPATAEFQNEVQSNDYIGLVGSWDEVQITAPTAIPGTPWQTDDIIYEVTMRVAIVGEFVSGGKQGILVPLSRIDLHPYTDRESDPLPGNSPPWTQMQDVPAFGG